MHSLNTVCTRIGTARDLATKFARLLRGCDVAALETWLATPTRSAHLEFEELAAGLRRDLAAVTAPVRETWSNGPPEGQVNKPKMFSDKCTGVEMCAPRGGNQKGSVERIIGWAKSSFFKPRKFLDETDLRAQLAA